jgi:hypothetical protein
MLHFFYLYQKNDIEQFLNIVIAKKIVPFKLVCDASFRQYKQHSQG